VTYANPVFVPEGRLPVANVLCKFFGEGSGSL
jgi:hypothetical protein